MSKTKPNPDRTPAIIEYHREADGAVRPFAVTMQGGALFDFTWCASEGVLRYHQSGFGPPPTEHDVSAYVDGAKWAPEARHPLYVAPYIALRHEGKPVDPKELGRFGQTLIEQPLGDVFEDADEGETDYCASCEDFYGSDGQGCAHIEFCARYHDDDEELDTPFELRDPRTPSRVVVLARVPEAADEVEKFVSFRHLGSAKRARLTVDGFLARYEQAIGLPGNHFVGVVQGTFPNLREEWLPLLRVGTNVVEAQRHGRILRFARDSGRCLTKRTALRLAFDALAQHGMFTLLMREVPVEGVAHPRTARFARLLGGDYLLDPGLGTMDRRIEPHESEAAAVTRLLALAKREVRD